MKALHTQDLKRAKRMLGMVISAVKCFVLLCLVCTCMLTSEPSSWERYSCRRHALLGQHTPSSTLGASPSWRLRYGDWLFIERRMPKATYRTEYDQKLDASGKLLLKLLLSHCDSHRSAQELGEGVETWGGLAGEVITKSSWLSL